MSRDGVQLTGIETLSAQRPSPPSARILQTSISQIIVTMATSDLSAKQKTDTPSVDFTPSTEIWYTDGSVVLVADKTAFRVHCTILATHCEMFKDMFAIPQPAVQDSGTETYEGCHVLRLQDSPTDLKHFLKSIYDFSYAIHTPRPNSS